MTPLTTNRLRDLSATSLGKVPVHEPEVEKHWCRALLQLPRPCHLFRVVYCRHKTGAKCSEMEHGISYLNTSPVFFCFPLQTFFHLTFILNPMRRLACLLILLWVHVSWQSKLDVELTSLSSGLRESDWPCAWTGPINHTLRTSWVEV